MFIKSSTETLNLFDPKKLDIQYLINLPSHDQTYLNQQRKNLNTNFYQKQDSLMELFIIILFVIQMLFISIIQLVKIRKQ